MHHPFYSLNKLMLMSRTKRWIEELMEKGEYPVPQETRLQINEPPFSADCPSCGQHFESGTEIPQDVICPSCYTEEQIRCGSHLH